MVKNQVAIVYLGMAFYRPVSFIALIAIMSVSIFYFIEDQDTMAKYLIFAAIYSFLLLFFGLKAVYYLRHRATFNELFFVAGLPLLPPILAALGKITGFDDLMFSDLFSATLRISPDALVFSLSFASILSLPYFFFSIYLLLRTFIRYEFIRWTPTSTSGPPATITGLFLAVIVGILYFFTAVLLLDVLMGLFGFIYAIIGILGFLV